MIAVDMPVTLRQMIDARLDNIERALMTKGTGRSDRHQILSAVEDQIMEMLEQAAGGEPSRDDVLRVLAKLDPPEAYLELSDAEPSAYSVLKSASIREHRVDTKAPPTLGSTSDFNILAIVSFVLLGMALFGSFSWWLLGFFGLVPLALVTIGSGICGTIALYQCIARRRTQRGVWMAITACACSPAIGFLTWLTFVVLEGM